MTTETFNIEIREDGSKNVVRVFDEIGKSSKSAADSAERLKKNLKFSDTASQLAGIESKLAQMNQRLNSFQGATSKLVEVVRVLRNTMTLLMYSFGLGVLADVLDSYTGILNKLRLVTEGSENLATVNERVFQSAQRTRSDYEQTANLYGRIARSTKTLGKSQEEVLGFTENVNKALVITGANGQEAVATLIQLGQALGSGRLAGDELRSILENNPRLARAIADGIGVSYGQLRKLGAEGKLTAKSVFEAIQSQTAKLDEEFKKIAPTISGGFTVLRNAALKFIGDFDQANKISENFAKGLMFLGNNFDTVARLVMVLGASLLVAFGPQILGFIGLLTTAFFGLTAAIASNPIGLIAVGVTAAASALFLFSDKIKITKDGAITLRDVFDVTFSYIGDGLDSLGNYWGSAWKLTTDSFSAVWKLATSLFSSNSQKAADESSGSFKSFINGFIGINIAAFKFVIKNWSLFPAAFGDLMAKAANLGIAAFEEFINFSSAGINNLIPTLNDTIAKLPGGKKDAIPLLKGGAKLGRIPESGANAPVGASARAEFEKALSVDYVGGFITKVRRDLKNNAKNRLARSRVGDGDLLDGDPNATGGDEEKKKKKKKGVDRAEELRKVNAELDQQIKLLGVEKEKREALQQFMQIESSLKDKKITLDKQERKAIEDKIQAIDTLKKAEEKREILKNKNEDLDKEVKLLGVVKKDREALGQILQIEAQLKKITKNLTGEEILQMEQLARRIKEVNQLKIDDASRLKIKEETEDINNQILSLQAESRERTILTAIYQFEKEKRRDGVSNIEAEVSSRLKLLTFLRDEEELSRNKDSILQSLGMTQEDYNRKLFALTSLLVEGKISSEQFNIALMSLRTQLNSTSTSFSAGFEEGFKGLIKTSKDFGSEVASTIGNAFQGIEDQFVSFVTTGKTDFKSMINSMLSDLSRLLIRYLIIQPLLKGLGGALKIPGLGSADGNVFENGVHVSPYANGGVISNPTIFPMAKGGVGLMGEAGPEAIMPLKRTPNGRLGISVMGSSGGGNTSVFAPVVSVTVEAGKGGQDKDQKMGDEVAAKINSVLEIKMADFIQKQKRPGGMLN
jgi:lambda family phage tail tape measure protein